MMRDFVNPENPLDRFRQIYEALNARRGWLQSATPIQFSAVSLVTTPGDPETLATDLYDLASVLKKRAGWFGDLNSSVRFLVAANLLRSGEPADAFLAAVERGGQMFREHGLRRGSIYEIIAILILRQNDPEGLIDGAAVGRFKAIYEMMKSYHWWLTGPDDYPACALLALRQAQPAVIGRRVEFFYEGLRKGGFSSGEPLQTVSHILYLNGAKDGDILNRFADLHEGFRNAGISMWRSDYDELAILTFLEHDPQVIVDRVVAHREVMEGLKPDPGRSLTFSLACGTAFLELARPSPELHEIADAKLLKQLQDILAAQQAAAVAVAASAAASAGSSS